MVPLQSSSHGFGRVQARAGPLGLADVTFTLTPKNEWDVVAGAALVESAGGFVSTLERTSLQANRRDPLLSGLLASGPLMKDKLLVPVSSLPNPRSVDGECCASTHAVHGGGDGCGAGAGGAG
jgi:hypothetical protein